MRALLLLGGIAAPVAGQFADLTDYEGVLRKASDFWSTSHSTSTGHPNCKYFYAFDADNSHGVKYDPHTGEVLFIDVTNNVLLGYYLDEGYGRDYSGGRERHYSEAGNEVAKSLDVMLSNLKTLNGLSDDTSPQVTLSNATIALSSTVTTVLMGPFRGATAPSNTSTALNELNYLANTYFEERLGGYQLLNVPNEMYRLEDIKTPSNFWAAYNYPWLNTIAGKTAVEFVVLSDPMDASLLFRSGELSGFGEELSTLLNGNYNLDLQVYGTAGMYKWVKHGTGVVPDQTEEDELRALLSQ